VVRLGQDHKSINYFVAGTGPQNRFIFESKTALARCQWASFGRILRIISRICCHGGYYGEARQQVAESLNGDEKESLSRKKRLPLSDPSPAERLVRFLDSATQRLVRVVLQLLDRMIDSPIRTPIRSQLRIDKCLAGKELTLLFARFALF
jgi:hypothetical protein